MESTSSNTQMHRSISMPVKPKFLESKALRRSDEKEILYDKDYYPESPIFRGKHPQHLAPDKKREDEDSLHSSDESKEEKSSILVSDNDYDRVWKPKIKNRLIEKNGRENVNFRNLPQKSWRYIRDFVTTLIELDWKYMLTMFLGSYFSSWFFFGVLCYLVAYNHGDMNFDQVTGKRLNEGDEPCIIGVYNFLSMLIYSIETQTTLGFGEKYPSEECPETIMLFIMQIICSIAIEGGMISIIYAKTARPAKQLTKLKFSRKAVICYRDGQLCLIFRVCDPREQQTIESKIRTFMITDKLTKEGELIKTQTELKLVGSGEQIIVWPELICHVIDETSPLYCYTNAKKFNQADFELCVTIVGVSATTAQVTEARTSYLASEIFWGQRFLQIVNYDDELERYVIDYANFNKTVSVDMVPSDE